MSALDEFRAEKDRFFGHHPSSPLTSRQRRDFQGLAYYPEDPALRLELPVERFREPQTVRMVTSTGDEATYRRWGRIGFTVVGQRAELTLYQDEERGELFLPFVDATGGMETYGAGRYLEPQPLDNGRVLADFNYAYNPYCAYNPRWSCPIPPAENRLQVPIRAGERDFPGAEH